MMVFKGLFNLDFRSHCFKILNTINIWVDIEGAGGISYHIKVIEYQHF